MLCLALVLISTLVLRESGVGGVPDLASLLFEGARSGTPETERSRTFPLLAAGTCLGVRGYSARMGGRGPVAGWMAVMRAVCDWVWCG